MPNSIPISKNKTKKDFCKTWSLRNQIVSDEKLMVTSWLLFQFWQKGKFSALWPWMPLFSLPAIIFAFDSQSASQGNYRAAGSGRYRQKRDDGVPRLCVCWQPESLPSLRHYLPLCRECTWRVGFCLSSPHCPVWHPSSMVSLYQTYSHCTVWELRVHTHQRDQGHEEIQRSVCQVGADWLQWN